MCTNETFTRLYLALLDFGLFMWNILYQQSKHIIDLLLRVLDNDLSFRFIGGKRKKLYLRSRSKSSMIFHRL